MINKTNTYQGTDVEHLFANSILECPRAWQSIKAAVGDYDNAIEKMPEVVGGNKRKADVLIEFEKHPPIRVSVKSFQPPGYNHIERRKLPDFCTRNQISKADTEFLTHIWLRKAKNDGKGLLVLPREQERIQEIFSTIEPGISALVGNDHPQILALYNKKESQWHLYDMNEQVLPLVRGQNIEFTSQASNIQIGKYIVIQRKGSSKGEGGSLDLMSLDHGSNNVQIKMKVGRFYNEVAPISCYVCSSAPYCSSAP